MVTLAPAMRLKVKRDTFYIPDMNHDSVYFRNNASSFRMDGIMIAQWIDMLLPMFNGEHTLKELTEGLPNPHKGRLMEIAAILYENGFVKDLSQEQPHQLTDDVLKKYSSQIEFLDHLGGSGAYRFQVFRQTKPLAIGSGPFFIALISALIESGVPHFHILISDSSQTDRKRLNEVISSKKQSRITIEEIPLDSVEESSWGKVIGQFDSVLYVSEGKNEELYEIHESCKQEKKVFIPAIFLNETGFAGPIVSPDSDGCWESAYRRMHHFGAAEKKNTSMYSATAGALLANVIVFELLKQTAGVTESKNQNRFYLLNLETMEGSWHSFIPHPLITGRSGANFVQDIHALLEQSSGKGEREKSFLYFNQLTSEHSGIFHQWEEGGLKQLPLAQCRVQVSDPLSAGQAEVLPETICSALTHMEARIEAGLSGVETYISRAAGQLIGNVKSTFETQEGHGFVGVGAGETFAESACRGLQKCLDNELKKRQSADKETVQFVALQPIEDLHCQYYYQVLTIMMTRKPKIAFGQDVAGFPVLWVGTKDGWQGATGLNQTFALRTALQRAVMKAQNSFIPENFPGLEAHDLHVTESAAHKLAIPSFESPEHQDILRSALKTLEINCNVISVYELELEPFLKDGLIKATGVILGEEGTN